MLLPPLLAASLVALPLVHAQYPPIPQYSNVLKSPLNPNISIAYTSPSPGTCTTVFPSQKQYTGYISIPPLTLAPIQQNYSINTFFWFIEARDNPETAPLTIYLNGGPGASSMFGLFQETGPCQVVQMADGTYGTEARMWGWDRSSNMIFIDQPDQVGFSYDTLTNGSYNVISENYTYPSSRAPAGQPAYTVFNGTFGSGQQSATPNTTQIAAHSMWHFLQTWLAVFPQYNPATTKNSTQTNGTAGIHLFTESYGGKYGPVFAKFLQDQNEAIRNGSLKSNSTLKIQLSSLGIINGLVDDLIQDYYYPLFAYNNTYGIQAISQVDELNSLAYYQQSCLPAITACRESMAILDPTGEGDVNATNTLCRTAQYACNQMTGAYLQGGRDPYDIRLSYPAPVPSNAHQEYLNMASVQKAIGAPVNYTEQSSVVQKAFVSTGDTISGVSLYDLADLLRMGVRVALMYGDADFLCNWMGGEAVSLALSSLLTSSGNNTNTTSSTTSSSTSTSTSSTALAPPVSSPTGPQGSYASAFPRAGYADIVVNSTYVGGAVRQCGNLSFSRIYDAGHFVPYYQPETAFTIFTRVILGTDISTGALINASNFSTTGPSSSNHTNSALAAQPSPTCWLRALNDTCSQAQISAIAAGQGVVHAGVWYANAADYVLPSSSVVAGSPGQPATASMNGKGSSSTPLTGVYTATGTPTSSSKAGSAAVRTPAPIVVQGLLVGALFGVAVL
ncbi:hypothetical protein MBLNU457_6666t1 [Dothideomycetes sp. NU457]